MVEFMLLYIEGSFINKPNDPLLLFKRSVNCCTLASVLSTFAMVPATSTAARLSVSLVVLCSVRPASVKALSALFIIPGTRWFSVARSVLSSRVDVVRFAVVACVLCSVCLRAGSASNAFTFIRILSNFGSIFSTAGTSCPTVSIMPPLRPPCMVSPTSTRSRGLLASRRFILTLPIRSLTISAELPFGIRKLLSTSN